MKKGLLFIFALVATLQLNAQTNFKLGLRAGSNHSINVMVKEGANGFSGQFRTGYHFGAISEIQLGKKLFLHTELLYSTRGQIEEYNSFTLPKGEGVVKYNYLTMPLLLEFRPIRGFGIELGPNLGHLLSAKIKFDSETVDLFEYRNIWGGYINRFDFGITGGLSYTFKNDLSLGFRFTHGFSSVQNGIDFRDLEGNKLDIKLQNRTFQFTVSYMLWKQEK